MSFHDFWTNENNPGLPQSEYLYGTRHIIVLVTAILASIILSLVFYRKSQKTKNILLVVLVSILLFFEIASRVVNLIIETEYTWQNVFKIIMPLHVCSVMVWVFIVAVFTKKQVLYNFAVIGGLLSTAGFLLYPSVGLNRTYMSFTCLYSTISHSVGFVCAILLMSLGFAKFEWKKIWQPLLCFAIMFGWGALVDFVILPGENYMYLRTDPLELDLDFPFHFMYIGILLGYILLFYIGYWIIQKIKMRKNKSAV